MGPYRGSTGVIPKYNFLDTEVIAHLIPSKHKKLEFNVKCYNNPLRAIGKSLAGTNLLLGLNMYEDRLTVSYDNNTLRAIGKPLADNDLLFDFNIKEDRLEIYCENDPNRTNDKFLRQQQQQHLDIKVHNALIANV
uniref:Ubiquitin-like domain-containing protein n=1 Tax=Glossina austeni TaxID=7395 RepID=A0A1A9UIG8_GLOAU